MHSPCRQPSRVEAFLPIPTLPTCMYVFYGIQRIKSQTFHVDRYVDPHVDVQTVGRLVQQ